MVQGCLQKGVFSTENLNDELPATNCTLHRTHIQHRSLNVYETLTFLRRIKRIENTSTVKSSLKGHNARFEERIPNNKMFKSTHALKLELL